MAGAAKKCIGQKRPATVWPCWRGVPPTVSRPSTGRSGATTISPPPRLLWSTRASLAPGGSLAGLRGAVGLRGCH
eukprot:9494674-Pyramimonas_sp.AAC.1